MRLLHRLVPLCAFVLPLAGAAAACGGDDTSAEDASGVVARFAAGSTDTPPFLDVPFPSDVYMKDGKLSSPPGLDRVFTQNADFLGQQIARVNGWSRIAPAMFALDDTSRPPNPDTGEPGGAAIDRATLPPDEDACIADGSSVFLIDLEAADPASARVPCRAVLDDEREAASGRTVLGVGPARGIVLAEGHRYAAVLTSRIKDESGRSLGSTADFARAIQRTGALGAIYGDAYDKALGAIGGALAGDGATIVALAPYTTQNVTGELYALRDALESAAAPTLSWDPAAVAPMTPARFVAVPAGGAGTVPAGFAASLDDWLGVATKKLPDGTDDPDEALPVRAHDAIDAVGTAVFQATSYLQVRPNKYDDLDHGTFARDASGAIVPAPEAPTAKIWVTFAIPKAPMPAGGYPAVIVQHGLSGSRDYLLSLANTFCKKGWIAVAIDSVTFGARAADPKFQVDQTTDYAGAPGAKYAGPDGISDRVAGERNGSFDFFGSLKNMGALRDQLRQAELDTAQLVKVLRSDPDLSPLRTGAAAPKIDPERVAYVGDSLGGIEGAVAAAIEPHVQAWTLNVAGGGVLVEIGAHGPGINAQLAIAGSINFGFRGVAFTEAHPLVAMGQTLVEAGDPLAYADKLVTSPAPLAGAPTAPRDVLQIEVLYDELVANEGGEALARAAGFGMALPNVGANAGAADRTGKPYPGGGLPLTMLTADATGGFHDTPKPGVTALVAQVSPAAHGSDLVRSTGDRQYLIPFNTEQGGLDPQHVDVVAVPCPYRALQDTMVRFFGDAFAGAVPVVTGLPAPARDLDGDGVPDDTDPTPLGK
jgi:dienelactone hydrolase